MQMFHYSDIDECSTGNDNCDVNADCINDQGSFSCQCREGYQGNGITCEGKKLYLCQVYHKCMSYDRHFYMCVLPLF